MGAQTVDSNAVIFLRGLNNDLKAKFKSYCAMRGKTMTEVLEQFMEKCASRVAEDADDKDERQLTIWFRKKKPSTKKKGKKKRKAS